MKRYMKINPDELKFIRRILCLHIDYLEDAKKRLVSERLIGHIENEESDTLELVRKIDKFMN